MHEVSLWILFFYNLFPFLICLHFILSRWSCEVVFSHPDFRAQGIPFDYEKPCCRARQSHYDWPKSWTSVIILTEVCVWVDWFVLETGDISVWWSWSVEVYQQELLRFSYLAFTTLKHCSDLFLFMYIFLK